MKLSRILHYLREIQENLPPGVDPMVTLVFSETGDVTAADMPVLETCCAGEGMIIRIYSGKGERSE